MALKNNKGMMNNKQNSQFTTQNSSLKKFSNFVIFQTKNGKVNIDVFFKDETLWLTQKLIAELFEKGRSTITEHLKKIFTEGELDEKVVCRDFRHTTQHGAIEGKTQTKEINLTIKNEKVSCINETFHEFHLTFMYKRKK